MTTPGVPRIGSAASNLPGELPNSTYRGSRALVVVLCLAAFGPYLVGSVRTEQLAVYATFPFVLFGLARLPSWSYDIVAAWSWTVLLATLGVVFPYAGALPWEPGSRLAGYDNLLLPLMTMVAILVLVPQGGARVALKTAARTVALASAANAIVATTSTILPLNFLLRPFWGAASNAGTVAESAQTMGRYAGVFAQPAEAGLVYSIAAVLSVWRYSDRPSRMYLLLTIITVGGVLSVSKVFLLVGLPVTIILLWLLRRGTARVNMVVSTSLIGTLILSATFIQEWDGFSYLTRLLEPPAGVSLIEFYTAGRWNSGAPMIEFVKFLLTVSPWTGVGAGGLVASYDSQWTESLVMGGVLGVLGVVAVLALLLAKMRRILDRDTRLTAFAFLAVLIGASFGIPSLTANRAATIIWVVAALLLLIAYTPSSAQTATQIGSRNPDSVHKLRRRAHRA